MRYSISLVAGASHPLDYLQLAMSDNYAFVSYMQDIGAAVHPNDDPSELRHLGGQVDHVGFRQSEVGMADQLIDSMVTSQTVASTSTPSISHLGSHAQTKHKSQSTIKTKPSKLNHTGAVGSGRISGITAGAQQTQRADWIVSPVIRMVEAQKQDQHSSNTQQVLAILSGAYPGATQPSSSEYDEKQADNMDEKYDVEAPGDWELVFTQAISSTTFSHGLNFDVINEAVTKWNEDELAHKISEKLAKINSNTERSPESNLTHSEKREILKKQLKKRYNLFIGSLMTYLNLYWTCITDLPQLVIAQRKTKLDALFDGEMRTEIVKQGEMAFKSSMQNRFIFMREPEDKNGGVLSDVRQHILSYFWLKSPHRKNKDKITFVPKLSETDSSDFNLWQGFQIDWKRAEEYVHTNRDEYDASIKLFLNHIKHILCQNDEDAYEYTLNWLAHLLQYPEIKMKVAILLRGEHGAGKGTIAMLLRRIIGRAHFTHFTNIGELTDKFNCEFLEKCLLGVVDEVTPDGKAMRCNEAQSSQIKTLITEDTHRVEQKFMPAFQINSCVNFIFLSNREQAVKVESGERRFFALEAADTYAGPETPETKEYFRKLQAVPPEYIAHFLYRRDLSQFNPRSFPVTKQLLLQKIFSLDSVQRWWYKQLETGSLPGSSDVPLQSNDLKTGQPSWQWYRVKMNIYNSYKDSCQSGNVHTHPVSDNMFWKKMKSIVQMQETRKKIIQHEPRVPVVSFDPWEDCIAYFATKVLRVKNVKLLKEMMMIEDPNTETTDNEEDDSAPDELAEQHINEGVPPCNAPHHTD